MNQLLANGPATRQAALRELPLNLRREAIVGQAYAEEIGMLSFDGAFSKKAVEVIRASLTDLHIVDTEPDVKSMLSTEFSPLK